MKRVGNSDRRRCKYFTSSSRSRDKFANVMHVISWKVESKSHTNNLKKIIIKKVEHRHEKTNSNNC
jgi:hypothetical protein